MTVIVYEKFTRYLPEKGKKLYFEKDDSRLYDEIIINNNDHRIVKEK